MKEVNKLDIPQHVECDTPDCIHWKDGVCAKESSVTIQEHHCVDYEERIVPPTATVTIEVRGGVVQNAYASPDLPKVGGADIQRRPVRPGAGRPSLTRGICVSMGMGISIGV